MNTPGTPLRITPSRVLVTLVTLLFAVITSVPTDAQADPQPTNHLGHHHHLAPSPPTSGGSTASPITPSQVRDRVILMLSHRHELPPKSAIDALPGGRDALEQVAKDHSAFQQRAAIFALGYYPDLRTFTFYKNLLQDPQTSNGNRHSLLIQIGTYFQNDAGFPILEEALKSPDVQFRLTAVFAIAKHDTERGFNLLAKHRKTEKDSVVIEEIDRLGGHVQ